MPALFSDGYFSLKKGSGDPKFLDFPDSLYELSEIKKIVFHCVLEKVQAHCAPCCTQATFKTPELLGLIS